MSFENLDITTLDPNQSIGPHADVTGIGRKGEIAGWYCFSLDNDGVPMWTFQNENQDDILTIWKPDVKSSPGSSNKLIMQEDGNLCLYDVNGKFLWGTMTQDQPFARGSCLALSSAGWAGLLNVQQPTIFGGMIWSVPTNFRLRVVPAPTEDPAPSPSPAFLDSLRLNSILKSAVVGAVGLIPEVGGILAKVTGSLWPEDKPSTLQWDQIREGVKTIAQGLIDEDKASKLHQDVGKLVNDLDLYNKMAPGIEEKRNYFSDIFFWFNHHQQDFLENATPWNTVQDFVQEGTLHLAFLHHRWHDWNHIYPNDLDKDTAAHKKLLEDTCDRYVATAKTIREKCMEWRFNQIQLTEWEDDGMRNILLGQDKKRYVKDNFRNPPVHREIKSRVSNDSSHVTGDSLALKYYENLRDYVDVVYRQQVDDILSPALLWPLFKEIPGTLAAKRRVTREVCWTTDIMGYGFSNRMHHFNDRVFAMEHGAITRIELYGHDRVDGFQVWYGGVSSGVRGAPERSGHTVALDIDVAKESIVEFSGHVSNFINALKVFVSPDKMIQAGGKLNFGGDEQYTETFHMGNREFGPHPSAQGLGTLKYLYGWYRDAGGAGYIEQLGAVFSRLDETTD